MTTHQICDVLPHVLSQIDEVFCGRPDLILASWPLIIGGKLAAMTKAESFRDGILTVKVKNSTLHSLLSQNDRSRILARLREQFPKVEIKSVQFRIG